MTIFTTNAKIKNFGGYLLKLTHPSEYTKCDMAVNVYLPPQAESLQATPKSVPVLFFLSGLTSTPDNCSEKGFLQYTASKRGIAIVYPDTSPRGADIVGENDSYDFGTGAGFYLDATREPWSRHYNMYSYIVKELPEHLGQHFPVLDLNRRGITGHSMGGHGALTIYLKNPDQYLSVSAFAPICNPILAPWGIKAFTGYFGPKEDGEAFSKWLEHDATELLKRATTLQDFKVLVDVGTADGFYKQGQLLPEKFEKAAKEKGICGEGFRLRFQEGYDHSYHFVASFSEEHVNYHADFLLK